MSGQISDASQSGCCITNCAVEELSPDILIKVASIEKPIKGRIMWRRGGSAGVKFIFDSKKTEEKPSKDLSKTEPAIISPKAAKPESGFEASVRNREQTLKFKCLVKNPNGTGCLIVAENTSALPDAITVQFGDLKKPINATITWRSPSMAGVFSTSTRIRMSIKFSCRAARVAFHSPLS